MSNRAKHRTTTSSESPTQTEANGSAKGNAKNKVKNNGHTSSGEPKESTELQRLKAERESITLWTRPVITIKYFLLELVALTQTYGKRLMNHTRYIAIFLICSALIAALHYIPGKHQPLLRKIWSKAATGGYWAFLGIISSIGLGTGLHTFLLYLGPFIASVTMAAYECNSLNFPSPPYPDDIICPENINPSTVVTVWDIIAKVRWEAMMWGLGTALGELPPYFVARTSRLSGLDPDDAEEVEEFENLQRKRDAGVELSLLERGKLVVEKLVERVGFFGILACASIPNPLFDLAGITCGHFLVPFSTFFGATLIGKALIKMHIQMIFVILAFNEPLMVKVLSLMSQIPLVGQKLQEPFSAFLESQKAKYHRNKPSQKVAEKINILGKLFEGVVILMILFFFVSIVKSLAQRYHKRIHKKSETRAAAATKNKSNKVSKD